MDSRSLEDGMRICKIHLLLPPSPPPDISLSLSPTFSDSLPSSWTSFNISPSWRTFRDALLVFKGELFPHLKNLLKISEVWNPQPLQNFVQYAPLSDSFFSLHHFVGLRRSIDREPEKLIRAISVEKGNSPEFSRLQMGIEVVEMGKKELSKSLSCWRNSFNSLS